MNIGKFVFSQVIDSLAMHAFRRGVARYDGNRYKKTFSCLDQYLRMTSRITHRESLRDIEVCPRAQKDKLYHRGIRGNVSRSAVTTSDVPDRAGALVAFCEHQERLSAVTNLLGPLPMPYTTFWGPR